MRTWYPGDFAQLDRKELVIVVGDTKIEGLTAIINFDQKARAIETNRLSELSEEQKQALRKVIYGQMWGVN